MTKVKRFTTMLLALLMVLSLGLTAIACGTDEGEGDGDDLPAQKVLQSISITEDPVKLDYVEGELFDPEGMVITARYSDGTREQVSDYTYTPNGALTLTDTVITVTWQLKTVQLDITVRMDGEYAASIDNYFDVAGHKLISTLEGEAPTRKSPGSNWERNYKDIARNNYASGGGFLGGSGFADNYVEYDILNDTDAIIEDAVIEIRLAPSHYLAENSWRNTQQEISRYFDITMFGVPVETDGIIIFPGEAAMETAYSNWVRMIIKDVRLIPGANTLRFTSKPLVDENGEGITSSANPGWGVINRIASLDVIYTWQPVDAADDAVETFEVHGLGERDGFEVKGAPHATSAQSYIFEIVTDTPLAGRAVNVSYGVNPFTKAWDNADNAADKKEVDTLRPETYTTVRGTRPVTTVAGGVSNKITVSYPNHADNYVYRITVPAAEIKGDIYIGAVTVGDYQTLTEDFFTASSWKSIPSTTPVTGVADFSLGTTNVSQVGGGEIQISGTSRRGYELPAAANKFHYSFMQLMNFRANGGSWFFFGGKYDETETEKAVDDAYYGLGVVAYGRIELRVSDNGGAGNVFSAISYDNAHVNLFREWNRYDIVGTYNAEGTLTLEIYINFIKWDMTLAADRNPTDALREAVSFEDGKMIHKNAFKGNLIGISANNTGYSTLRSTGYYYSASHVAEAVSVPTNHNDTTIQAESDDEVTNAYVKSLTVDRSKLASLDNKGIFDDADALGGKYVGGLNANGRGITFKLTMAKNKTVGLVFVMKASYKGQDMKNLNNFMMIRINGVATDLSQITLTDGDWLQVVIWAVPMTMNEECIIEVLPVTNFPYNYHNLTDNSGSIDYFVPNIDALRVFTQND